MFSTFRQGYNLYFSPDRAFAKKIKNITGITPVRLNLYRLAFLHKSMNGEKDKSGNNERLEYLGDSILSTVIADYLYKKYPLRAEGFLTTMRSKIVKRKTLNQIASNMGLDMILVDYSQGNMSSTMLGNALEALIGAKYLESGYAHTRNYIVYHLIKKYVDIDQLEKHDDNYKSKLLEYCQKNSLEINFKLIEKYKFEKRDRFRVAVLIDGEVMGKADNFNKKSAEQAASKCAIEKLRTETSVEI